MAKQVVVLLSMLLFAFAARTAHAFIDPPWITPEVPRAGETVSVNVRLGICDAFFFMPGYPQISQEGNVVRILEYGHHWEDDELCGYGIGVATEPIGAFPLGDYTLVVDFIYEDYPFGYTTITLGIIPFTVRGVAAAPVPTFHPWGLCGFLLLISSLAMWALRTRRRCSG